MYFQDIRSWESPETCNGPSHQIETGAITLTLDGLDPDLYHPQLLQSPAEPSLTWLAYQGVRQSQDLPRCPPPRPPSRPLAKGCHDRHQADSRVSEESVCVCVRTSLLSLFAPLFKFRKISSVTPSTKRREATAPSCLHFRGRGHVKTAHGSALAESRLQEEHFHGSSGVTERLQNGSLLRTANSVQMHIDGYISMT